VGNYKRFSYQIKGQGLVNDTDLAPNHSIHMAESVAGVSDSRTQVSNC